MADSAPFSSGLAAPVQKSYRSIPPDCAKPSSIPNICVGSTQTKKVALHNFLLLSGKPTV
jgi:hypothetical protein